MIKETDLITIATIYTHIFKFYDRISENICFVVLINNCKIYIEKPLNNKRILDYIRISVKNNCDNNIISKKAFCVIVCFDMEIDIEFYDIAFIIWNNEIKDIYWKNEKDNLFERNFYAMRENTRSDIIKGKSFRQLTILSIKEKKHQLEFNNINPICFDKELSIMSIINRVLKNNKSEIALYENNKTYNYSYFDELSTYYAYVLDKEYSNRIGLHCQSLRATIIGLLAIFKIGKCCVTINSLLPDLRKEEIIESNKVELVLSDIALNLSCNKLYIEELNELNSENKINFRFKIDDSECYIIQTSGSTGKSKSVIITYKNLSSTMQWMLAYFKQSYQIRSLHLLSYCFDFGLYDIFFTLMSGGTLFSNFGAKNIFLDNVSTIKRQNINHICITPSYMNILLSLRIQMPTLKIIHFGGEKLDYSLINRLKLYVSVDCDVYNGYGPCECTIGNSIYKISMRGIFPEKGRVPIGNPSSNNNIYIYDRQGDLLPIGAMGEICISGNGVGRGYTNVKYNIDKFIADPLINYLKMYKSGDIGRWLLDGNIDYLFREDNQIKLNGYRIELEEIENCCNEYQKGMRSMVKVENNKLFLYFVSKEKINVKDLDFFLRKHLPLYMCPHKIEQLQELPMSHNGKLLRGEKQDD